MSGCPNTRTGRHYYIVTGQFRSAGKLYQIYECTACGLKYTQSV